MCRELRLCAYALKTNGCSKHEAVVKHIGDACKQDNQHPCQMLGKMIVAVPWQPHSARFNKEGIAAVNKC